MPVGNRFQLAPGEKRLSKGLHVGQRRRFRTREGFRREEMKLAGKRVPTVTGQHVRFAFMIAPQSAESDFLQRFKPSGS